MATQRDVREWLEHPVTAEVLREVRNRYPGTEWKAADSWEAVNRMKGRQEIIDFLIAAPDYFRKEEET